MKWLALPESFKPERYIYGGLQGFADCEPYIRHAGGRDMRWCDFSRVASGTAAVYPVKLLVPGRGEGQFKYEEVERWRYLYHVLDALVELDRHKGLWAVLEDRTGSAIPPGIDPVWAWAHTGKVEYVKA